jgi:hypothetical protein
MHRWKRILKLISEVWTELKCFRMASALGFGEYSVPPVRKFLENVSRKTT